MQNMDKSKHSKVYKTLINVNTLTCVQISHQKYTKELKDK